MADFSRRPFASRRRARRAHVGGLALWHCEQSRCVTRRRDRRPRCSKRPLLGRTATLQTAAPITPVRGRATLRTRSFGCRTDRSRPSTGVSAAELGCSPDRTSKKVRTFERQRTLRLKTSSRPDGPSRLPLGGFTYCLTLSSKCFSTFPHGTCSLSVPRPYLALDGVYHPLWAAFSNNPTPGKLRALARTAAKGLTPAVG